MNYNKKTVYDVALAGKKVLLRCDFNVPQDKATGAITDDKRIVAALPTIQYLLDQGAAAGLCTEITRFMTFTGVFLGRFCEQGEADFDPIQIQFS